MKKYFVHAKALVETKQIGDMTSIWAFTHILAGAKIGKNTNINDHCFIENDAKIGDNVTVKCGVYLWDGLTVEDNVQIGPSVSFVNDKLPRAKNKRFKLDKTVLKNGCSIGANATILGGISIGQYSLVGAGSVVTKSVPDFTLVFGNPATIHSNICICCNKIVFNKQRALCRCGRAYSLLKNRVMLDS
jgi:acetyltransferase-like isoleucine patch superfamily enzyme